MYRFGSRYDVYRFGSRCDGETRYNGEGRSSPLNVPAVVESSGYGCAIVDSGTLTMPKNLPWWELFRRCNEHRLGCGDDGPVGAYGVCDWTSQAEVDAEEGKGDGAGKPWLKKVRHADQQW